MFEKRITLLLILILPILGKSQGLLFNSNDSLIAHRTSYDVFAQKQPHFNSSFQIDFDLSIIDSNSFGYILSIADKTEATSYSLTYLNSSENSFQIRFNLDGVQNLLKIPLDQNSIGNRKWIKISLFFDPANEEIKITVNGKSYTCTIYQFNENIVPLLFFGKHESDIDVPYMAIKNLTIKEDYEEFEFQFNESEGNIVYDVHGTPYGEVSHPNWLINDSYHWKHKFTHNFKSVSALSFDESNQRFVFITSDSIGFYYLEENKAYIQQLENKFPVEMKLGTSIVAPNSNELYVYEVNDLDYNTPTIAKVNLDNLETQILSTQQLPRQRHHHNLIPDKENNRFIVFGGFGNQRLSNEFNTFDLSSNTWNTLSLKGDTISPRFFSGYTRISDKEILLFGGVGNKTGDQSIGKTYYYDCYKINFEKKSVDKLWEIFREASLASSRNMVLSNDSTSFYTLNYPEYIPSSYLQIHRYDLKDGDFEVLGDTIPIISERIRTNANLYVNQETSELFCTVQEFELDGSNTIKIFSLNNPPVSKETITKYNHGKNLFQNVLTYAFLGLLLFILISYILIKKWNITRRRKQQQIQSVVVKNQYDTPIKSINNSISLFGKFTVLNPNGKDISYQFSPKIRNLFLLILLNSWKKTPPGIGSEEISSTLWPDKEPKKVKNAKNVAINQLRKTLQDLNGLEVKYSNGRFNIENNTHFNCDYFDFMTSLEVLKENIGDKASLEQLISISKKGSLLFSFNHPYFDKIKTYFEYEVLTVIPDQLKLLYNKQDYATVIQMTNILANIDSLNEFSLYYKIHALLKLGLLDQAKKHYNKFIVEYKRILDDDFPYTLTEISEKIPDNLK